MIEPKRERERERDTTKLFHWLVDFDGSHVLLACNQPDLKDYVKGQTALHVAAFGDRPDVVKVELLTDQTTLTN